VGTVTDNPGTERADLIRAKLAVVPTMNNVGTRESVDRPHVVAALRSIVDMAEQAYGDCGYYDPDDPETPEELNPRRCVSHCDCGWGTLWAGTVLNKIGRILGVTE
jgi:hypothetical protein